MSLAHHAYIYDMLGHISGEFYGDECILKDDNKKKTGRETGLSI